jgi:hypothetical protein
MQKTLGTHFGKFAPARAGDDAAAIIIMDQKQTQ